MIDEGIRVGGDGCDTTNDAEDIDVSDLRTVLVQYASSRPHTERNLPACVEQALRWTIMCIYL